MLACEGRTGKGQEVMILRLFFFLFFWGGVGGGVWEEYEGVGKGRPFMNMNSIMNFTFY